MRTRVCTLVRDQLGAFVDSELTGAERLDVAQHLKVCAVCAREVDELIAVGDDLRAAAAEVQVPLADLAGLAPGVFSRTRAEAAISWQGRLSQAGEDSHWFVVVGGALAATLVTALLTSALLAFGPKPELRDSLAGQGREASRAAEVEWTFGARSTFEQDAQRILAYRRIPADELTRSEALLTDQLARSFDHGNASPIDPANRIIQEALLEEIIRLRLDEPVFVPSAGRVLVSEAISERPARDIVSP